MLDAYNELDKYNMNIDQLNGCFYLLKVSTNNQNIFARIQIVK